eukprot:m.169683 g.169683  ORF g.169683 m.169683 type:complete len:382 (-) comp16671_c0_seq21:42-1187(-)
MHVSMFNNARYTNTSNNGLWGDGVRELNDAVKDLLRFLRSNGLENNTLVMLTSDHGPHIELCLEGGRTGGLKGGKSYSSWEGGLKVPGVAWWPGVIQPGRVTNELASSMDMFATAVDFAGGSLPTDRVYDGRSLRNVLTNITASGPHQSLFHYCSDVLVAVRYQDYKITYFSQELPFANYTQVHCTAGSPHSEFFQGSACHGQSVTSHAPPLIYHIAQDPGELFPSVVQETCDATQGEVYPSMVMPGVGYSSKVLPDLSACRSWCCNDSSCGSVTFEESSPKSTKTCTEGQACCYLNPLQPVPLTPRTGVTVAFVKRQGTGPLGDVITAAYELVAEHHHTMRRGHPQLGKGDKAAQPCCHDASHPDDCGCNYTPPLVEIVQ